MGTPAYMPPEQARGDNSRVDARADVFALGAMLCQILTGQPPYVGDTALAICRDAAEGNLADAQARLRSCGADRALCELSSRCLAADRESRIGNAEIVAREISAFLAASHERLRRAELDRTAAEARADSATAKARAERRSRQWTAAFAMALLVGGGVAAWQAVVATRAKSSATTAALLEREAKEAAMTREAETRAVLDFVQKRILAAARPKGRPGGLGQDVTLRKALESALEAVDKDFADQPLVEARMRGTLGSSFRFLGDASIAVEQCERARALYTKLLGPEHPDTLRSTHNLANCYADLGRLEDALKLDEEIFALQKATHGAGNPKTFSSMNNLAHSYAGLGRHAEALKLREELLALRQANPSLDESDKLVCMANLAASYYAVGRYSDAVKVCEQSLSLQQTRFGSDHPDTLSTTNTLAGSYAALGRHAEALQYCEQVLARRRAALGRDHPDTIKSMHNLANCYAALARHDDAVKLAEESFALQKVKLGPDHPNTLLSQNNLAMHYADVGRHNDSLNLRAEALALFKHKLGPDHPDTLWSMWALAASLVKLERGAEAVPIIDECVRRAAGQTVQPDLLPGVLEIRVRHFAKLKDVTGCRETAEMWEALRPAGSDGFYQAARFRSVAAKIARSASATPGDTMRADAEADRAMEWLNKAIKAGFKDLARLSRDRDFDDLRNRSDFSRLISVRASPS